MDKLKPAAFILGTGRSGTTLLRVMLAGHPALWSPPETKLSLFQTMAERLEHVNTRYWEKGGLRRGLMDLEGLDVAGARAAVDAMAERTVPEVYARLQAKLGDRMLVEKEPTLTAYPAAMARLEQWFDQPRFVWIVRHPGAVVRSFQNMPMAEVMTQGMDVDWRTAWHTSNANVRDFLATIDPERWIRIRYEDLVTDPGPVLEGICDTLGVPFDEAVLHPYDGDRMREGPKGARATGDPNMAGRKHIHAGMATKWLDGFDPQLVSAETRQLASELGYDLDSMPRPPITGVSEGIASLMQTATELEAAIDLPSDLDNVEGRRFLLRMLSASIDTFVEHADGERPHFHHAEGPTRKMFADCPDTHYLRAPIRVGEGRVYRLSGRVPPGTLYCGVLLYGRGGRVARSLTDAELGCGEDGSFELRISTEPQEGVWLQADGDENAVMVRQYFADCHSEARVEVQLERIDANEVPESLDPRRLAKQLTRAERMLRAVFERTLKGYKMVRAMALNRFVEVPADALFPTPDNQYRVCWYRFGPDQVMVVRGRLPDSRYFGLSLCNAWMESLDYVTWPRTNLNHSQIQTDAEGRFEIVLAHRDPGHPNWMPVAGHDAGYLLARYLLPESELPELTTQVMYEHELTSV